MGHIKRVGHVRKFSIKTGQTCVLDQHRATVPYFYQQKPADDKQSHVFSVPRAVEGVRLVRLQNLWRKVCSHQHRPAAITRKAPIWKF